MNIARLKLALQAIAAITMVSGAAQLVLPGFVLDLLAAESTPTTRHFFAIVGMFMFLFGGMLLHGLRVSPRPDVILLWASLQKFGAAAAVGIGVGRGVFSALALLVAGFDLLSGALIFWYRSAAARK
ncbi:MAG: patatin [Actinomycetota bacterium]